MSVPFENMSVHSSQDLCFIPRDVVDSVMVNSEDNIIKRASNCKRSNGGGGGSNKQSSKQHHSMMARGRRRELSMNEEGIS